MRFLISTLVSCTLLLVAACSQPAPPRPQPEVAQKPPEPVIPPEIIAVAESALGSEAEVLTFGDLARTGGQQVLVVNRLKKAPSGAVPGILVTRVAIVEKEGEKWKELFRCDEHLKNPKGFLAATPVAPVPGWRLQYEESPQKGLSLYFTPLQQPVGSYIQTIGVRWNPKAKRYQSLDRSFEQFLGETPTLQKVGFDLRR